jgi:hypothetical protein
MRIYTARVDPTVCALCEKKPLYRVPVSGPETQSVGYDEASRSVGFCQDHQREASTLNKVVMDKREWKLHWWRQQKIEAAKNRTRKLGPHHGGL